MFLSVAPGWIRGQGPMLGDMRLSVLKARMTCGGDLSLAPMLSQIGKNIVLGRRGNLLPGLAEELRVGVFQLNQPFCYYAGIL